jgi:two-component system response regulator LytT
VKALVVDDEPLVRSELVYALARSAGGDCDVNEAATAREALAMLRHDAYDVIFLDIRMPGLNGIDAVAEIDRLPRRPFVVFVSAYAEHTLKAFEVAAFDYLLKPVTEERLAVTIWRLRSRLSEHAPFERGGGGRIPLDGGGRTVLARPDDIRFVQAHGHVVTVALFDQALRFHGTLAACAQRLAAHEFIRAHRAYLVNPRRVVEVLPSVGGTYALRVDDKAASEVPVSRNYVAAVRAKLRL